jgi:predicted enzyme related to lactoylglutathione lyase
MLRQDKHQEVAAPDLSKRKLIFASDFDAALARIAEAGGTVVQGPMEVPGGAWIAQARDPQGAFFAITGRRG